MNEVFLKVLQKMKTKQKNSLGKEMENYGRKEYIRYMKEKF